MKLESSQVEKKSVFGTLLWGTLIWIAVMAVNILTVVIFDLERDSKSILNMFASIFALAIVFDFSNRRHPRRWGLSIFLGTLFWPDYVNHICNNRCSNNGKYG